MKTESMWLFHISTTVELSSVCIILLYSIVDRRSYINFKVYFFDFLYRSFFLLSIFFLLIFTFFVKKKYSDIKKNRLFYYWTFLDPFYLIITGVELFKRKLLYINLKSEGCELLANFPYNHLFNKCILWGGAQAFLCLLLTTL